MRIAIVSFLLLVTAPARADLEPREPPGVELGFQYGLVQPIVMHGLNAALDVRWRRLIFTYSHGAGLDVGPFLSGAETKAGLRAVMPFSTGGGVGIVLAHELYVLLDVKWHRYHLALGAEHPSYDTVTVGGEIGWRLFLWKGLYVNPVVRYWPNVWTSAPDGGVVLENGALIHQPMAQGFHGLFPNVLVGWAVTL